MQKLLIFLFLFLIHLHALDFKVASYNVENLFDLTHDKTEYKEYIPYFKSKWNDQALSIKLHNIAQVINELDAHIIALQEIESELAIQMLIKKTPQYEHYAFTKNKNSAVGLAVLSKYPITNHESITFKTKVNRPIQKVTININNHPLIIFNNHWASKRNKESHRVKAALELQKVLAQLPKQSDYLLVGDFNSNYNENQTILSQKRLNNTQGFTGMNHVLNTVVNKNIITKQNIAQQTVLSHYNLWYELASHKRYSSKFRNNPNTPDNILVSKALFDSQKIAYVNNSFKVFKPHYLYKNGIINRWKISKKKVHQQKGYSDHLPIFASFTLNKYEKDTVPLPLNIKDLYTQEQLQIPLTLQNVTVLYKHNNHAIIKTKHDKAIFLYNCAQKLKTGFNYKVSISAITNFHGLKEVTKIKNVEELNYNKTYKELFLNASLLNLHDIKYQNEMLYNISGIYKKGYLHFKHKKKIRLYAKDKKLLPKHGENITIISGHLGYFKNQAQIIIYKKSDIKVNF